MGNDGTDPKGHPRLQNKEMFGQGTLQSCPWASTRPHSAEAEACIGTRLGVCGQPRSQAQRGGLRTRLVHGLLLYLSQSGHEYIVHFIYFPKGGGKGWVKSGSYTLSVCLWSLSVSLLLSVSLSCTQILQPNPQSSRGLLHKANSFTVQINLRMIMRHLTGGGTVTPYTIQAYYMVFDNTTSLVPKCQYQLLLQATELG